MTTMTICQEKIRKTSVFSCFAGAMNARHKKSCKIYLKRRFYSFGAGYESRTRHLLLGKATSLRDATPKNGFIQVLYRLTPIYRRHPAHQQTDVRMCINVERGGDIRVSQNLFHHLRCQTGSHHFSGGGMAAGVGLHALDAQFLHQATKGFSHIVVVPWDTILRWDQEVRVISIQPVFYKWLDVGMQRDHSVPAGLSFFSTNQVAIFQMHIFPAGGEQFIQAHACVGQHKRNAGRFPKALVIRHGPYRLHLGVA